MVTPDIIRKLIADGYISMCAVHSIHLGYWSSPELSGKIPAPREARYVEACMVHEDCASDIGLGVACAAGTRKDAMQALVAITGAVKVTEIEPSNTRK